MLDQDKIDILKKAINLLEKIELTEDDCSIVAENSYSESVFIGTNDSYMRLAIFLLNITKMTLEKQSSTAEIDLEKEIVKNVECFASGDLKNFFHEDNDIWPVCAFIVKNRDDFQKLNKQLQNT